jgi:sigma-E factor negative regulatory protein RseA
MDTTKNIMREQVSALADGELDSLAAKAVLESLGDKSSQEDWEVYHRIGDVLRSEELAAPLSANFAARMAASLEAETPHSSALPNEQAEAAAPVSAGGGMFANVRRYLLPGMAGTVALAAAVMMAPQWMMGTPDSTDMSVAAQAPQQEVRSAAIIPAAAPENIAAAVAVSNSQILVSEDDIVRDPRIDQYLMAHQRLSPSAQNSSQFARSATFAAEADK